MLMNKSLEQVFQDASKLSEADQKRFAAWARRELTDRRWDEHFTRTQPQLEKVLDQVQARVRQGKFRKLDLKELH